MHAHKADNVVKFPPPPAPAATAAPSDDDGDWELIARIGAGDERAFETFYRRYRRYLERFIYQIMRRNDLVEDVISEVMLAVWQQAARTERLARASTWLLGIANFKALHALRKAGVSVSDAALDDPGDDALGQRELEQDDLMMVALRSVSAEQRAVLELVYFHGLHYDDIARVLDCPENTVKTRVFHARKRLRALWPRLSGEVGGRTPR